MKILHIVSALGSRSGGPTRSIKGLCRGLAQRGVETTLFVFSPEYEIVDSGKVRFIKGRGLGLRTARQDVIKVIDEVKPDIIHLHGLWMMVNHLAFCIALRQKFPIVLSVRGMLDPWALRQKAWKKKTALWFYQRHDLTKVTCFHATAEQEAMNIRAQGLRQPICVIPNGVDVPLEFPQKNRRPDRRKVALFLSRLHPGKGLMDLVAAWERMRPENWVVRIVGPDVCGYKEEVVAEIKKKELQADFEFVGELDDSAKWQEYINADLFIHPSHSENFGISIAEALAAGLPVITTKGAPWQELQGSSCHSALVHECESSLVEETGDEGKSAVGSGSRQSAEQCSDNELMNSRTNELAANGRCGWWIDIGVEPLVEALREAMGLSDEERRAMGENGRKLVEAKYTWPAIAEQMKAAYAWILNGGERPDCVNVE